MLPLFIFLFKQFFVSLKLKFLVNYCLVSLVFFINLLTILNLIIFYPHGKNCTGQQWQSWLELVNFGSFFYLELPVIFKLLAFSYLNTK